MSNVKKFARDLVTDAQANKGSAFTEKERDQFRLQGLFPCAVETLDHQVKRQTMLVDEKTRSIDKYMHLMEILNRNETLFYKLVCSDIKKFMPLVYTPTVGEACQKYSHIWSQPKGMYITRAPGIGKAEIYKMLCNWRTRDIKAIVFTDGQRILGLGDLGINGMGIPAGKLQLYSACAGIPPSQCLPVTIDNGTNTELYLNDDLYMGQRRKRANGPEYYTFIRDFMEAACKAFGRSVLLQFEDFGNETAFDLLKQNQYDFNCFNDDIQGTACVALAGVLAALKMDGVSNNLSDHRVLFLGAGEAGTGIGELIAYAISKQSGGKITQADACRDNIFFVDSKGLISTSRKDKLPHHKEMFQQGSDLKCEDFLQAVKVLKPTMIVGVSAQPKKFTKEVCEEMAKNNDRPIIFALSNPTHKCECTAEQAYKWTNETCIFASGSPFPDYCNSDGSIKFRPGQGNNAYIFPGIALGCIAAEAKFIPQDLFLITAEALAGMVKEADTALGSVYPPLEDIREVSLNIATEVAYACYHPIDDPRPDAESPKIILANAPKPKTGIKSKMKLRQWIAGMMDDNEYKAL